MGDINRADSDVIFLARKSGDPVTSSAATIEGRRGPVRRLISLASVVAMAIALAGPARADVSVEDQARYQQVTGFSTAGSVGPIEKQAAGGGCRVMSKGYAYRNGYGQTTALFVGNLRWCWNNGRVTSGSMWITVQRCCFWLYEGLVHEQNLGCFNGCTYVYEHRRGSFIFNPPWPAWTTRVQPWFALGGNGNGTIRVWASGG